MCPVHHWFHHRFLCTSQHDLVRIQQSLPQHLRYLPSSCPHQLLLQPQQHQHIHLNNGKATPDGNKVTTVLPGHIEFSIANGSQQKSSGYKSVDRVVKKVVHTMECSGEGLCVLGAVEGLFVYALKGAVPMCCLLIIERLMDI